VKPDSTQFRDHKTKAMSRRFTLIYLGLAPAIFALSWYISHRLYLRFLRYGTGDFEYQGDDRSLVYAGIFTGLYLAAYLVIRDLYKPSRN
jgi:hypothetical protein